MHLVVFQHLYGGCDAWYFHRM